MSNLQQTSEGQSIGEEYDFNFNKWIEQNNLEEAKELFVKYAMTKKDTISLTSPSFIKLISDLSASKPTLTPIVVAAIQTLSSLTETSKHRIVAEEEHEVIDKIKSNLKEIDQFEVTVNSLNKQLPDSVRRIKQEKLTQIAQTKKKTSDSFDGIKQKIHICQQKIQNDLNQIQSTVNPDNDEQKQEKEEAKENEILNNSTEIIQKERAYLTQKLNECNHKINSIGNDKRKQRKQEIVNIGQTVTDKFSKCKQLLNENIKNVENVVEQNNKSVIKIDFVVNERLKNKLFTTIQNVGFIVNEQYQPESPPDAHYDIKVDEDELMMQQLKQKYKLLESKYKSLESKSKSDNRSLKQELQQKHTELVQGVNNVVNQKQQLEQKINEYKSLILKLQNENKSLKQQRKNYDALQNKLNEEKRARIIDRDTYISKLQQSISLPWQSDFKWVKSDKDDEKQQGTSNIGQIISNDPTSVKFVDGSIKQNVSNNLLSANPITHDIDEICEYNKKLIENTTLLLSKYIKLIRKFVYEYDFDENGVCYALGTEFGKKQWINPMDKGVMSISSSGWHDGKNRNVVARGPVAANNYTKNEPKNGWICIDFLNGIKIKPNAYTLRHDRNTSHYLRSWNLEGSVDGLVWEIIKQHANDTAINQAKQSHTWTINNCSTSYGMFRIFMTGPNADSSYYIFCHGFEIYGDVSV